MPNDHSHESQLIGLLTQCQLSLGRYVRGLMPGDAAANDVLQAANAKIWENRDDFELGPSRSLGLKS